MSKDFNKIGAEIGALVTSKNADYGDSFAKCGEFLRLLFPTGIQPAQYEDSLALVRIFDKQMRVATRKDAFGESPYRDIAGYGILGAAKDESEPMKHPFDLVKEGKLPPAFGPFIAKDIPDGPCPAPDSVRYSEIHTPLSDEAVQKISGECKGCVHPCSNAGSGKWIRGCQFYTPAPPDLTPEPLDLRLPSITLPGDAMAVWEKYLEEWREWARCNDGDMDQLIEAWDCVQALQTYKERGGNGAGHDINLAEFVKRLNEYMEDGRPVMEAKRQMISKNASRMRLTVGGDQTHGYYDPSVCAAILNGTWSPS